MYLNEYWVFDARNLRCGRGVHVRISCANSQVLIAFQSCAIALLRHGQGQPASRDRGRCGAGRRDLAGRSDLFQRLGLGAREIRPPPLSGRPGDHEPAEFPPQCTSANLAQAPWLVVEFTKLRSKSARTIAQPDGARESSDQYRATDFTRGASFSILVRNLSGVVGWDGAEQCRDSTQEKILAALGADGMEEVSGFLLRRNRERQRTPLGRKRDLSHGR